MIIVNQNRNEIINFNNVMNIGMCGEDGEYIISAGVVIGIEDNYRELGVYKKEERAKEYSKYLELKGGPAILQGQIDIAPAIFNIPKVYYMPEE